MRPSSLIPAILLAFACTYGVAAASPAVVAYEHDAGLFFADPGRSDRWVEVSDESRTCRTLKIDVESTAGLMLARRDGRPVFISNWGVFYEQTADSTWQVVGRGLWLADERQSVEWARYTRSDDHAPISAIHHLYWRGAGVAFVNDARDLVTIDNYEFPFAPMWYRLDDDGTCSVMTEASRTYAEPDLQTIRFAPETDGAMPWTVQTGRATQGASVSRGNWLR